MSSTNPMPPPVSAAYEIYFGHTIPTYALQKYSRQDLTRLIHDALIKGEPVEEFKNHVRMPNSFDEVPAIGPLPQDYRNKTREEYLKQFE